MPNNNNERCLKVCISNEWCYKFVFTCISNELCYILKHVLFSFLINGVVR